ncbi:hypothetical protein [Paracoccus albus]|uniref:hypothetical protein n=1 Tax=Paracoccus albus TaxID=3017784 RepID=UPI0022F022E2|nr:hypothetical protein [Paracoccus albus]WBU60377.1 hypothetical protein PAF20_00120 [Paracoccus albus]
MIRARAIAILGLSTATLSACGLSGGSDIVSRPEAAAREAAAAGSTTTTGDGLDGGYVEPVAAPSAAPAQSSTSGLQGGGQTVAQLDTTSAEEKAAAAAPASGGGLLGTTVASLGDATEGGFWIKTPLVSAAGKGRVVNPASGKSANVDLQPLGGGGSGSQLSLAAMQALDVPLTELPEIEVWQN